MSTVAALRDPSELPLYTRVGDPDWGADLSRFAATLFAYPEQGLMRLEDGTLVVYRNDDLQLLARNPAVTHTPHEDTEPPPGVDEKTAAWFGHIAENPFDRRAPEHMPRRKLGMRRVTKNSMGRFSEVAAGVVDELVDELSSRDQIEFRPDFAQPLLVRFWSQVLGLTEDELVHALAVLDDFFAVFKLTPTEAEMARAYEAGAAYMEVMTTGLEREARKGENLLLQELLEDFEAIEEGSGRPAGPEIFFGAFAVDAFHTLASQVCNVMQAMLIAPEEHERVRADRGLLRSAFFEGSRLQPGVAWTFRQTSEAIEHDGVAIPAETPLLMLWSAGSRDPEYFPDPDAYLLERENRNRQQTFGGGIYVCPGRNLGELMGLIVLDGLTKPDVEIELLGDTEWTSRAVEHTPVRMPVRLRRR